MYTSLGARGRSWYEADTASMTVFDDCVRVNLFWSDGEYAYDLVDTKEEAIQQLSRYGFGLLEI